MPSPLAARRGPRTYDDLILSTPGLVGYWRLNERSGTVARDSFGSNHGTYVGSPTLGAPGLLADGDTAVTLAGGTQEVITPVFDASGTKPFTLIVWLKHTPDATTRLPIVSALSGTAGGVALDSETTGVGLIRRDAAGAQDLAFSATPLTAGAKYMLVGTFDGTTMLFFKNGLLAAGPTASSRVVPALNVTGFGRTTNMSSSRVNGTLARPAFLNRALTPGEIADLYRAGIGA